MTSSEWCSCCCRPCQMYMLEKKKILKNICAQCLCSMWKWIKRNPLELFGIGFKDVFLQWLVFGLGYVKLPAVHTFSSGIDFYVCTSVALESSVVPGLHCWKDVPVPMSHRFHYCCNYSSYFQYWKIMHSHFSFWLSFCFRLFEL